MTEAGAHPLTYTGYYDDESRSVQGVVPIEETVTLYLNGQVLVRLMCTPTKLDDLALGFLYNEGLIDGIDEVTEIGRCGSDSDPDIWLAHDVEIPQLRAITSGCSGGTTFEDVSSVDHSLASDLRIAPQQVTELMEKLSEAAALYRRAGGIHTAALAMLDKGELVCVASDVGRHNTLDKIAGSCLRRGQPTQDGILLTSGRVSSEMVSKVARMEVPVVVSGTSPTSLSVELAHTWGITLIGYTRRRSFRVYAGEERISADASS